jgi:hypothetical protein
MQKNIQIAVRLRKSEEGFALVAAVMACLILFALGMLIISISTQDIRISTKIVGDKRALAVAEEGIHRINETFNPQTVLTDTAVGPVYRSGSASSYTINYPAVLPATGPEFIVLRGYQIGGGQTLGLKRYSLGVVGRNDEYNSQVAVSLGIGYGPVDITPSYR